MITQKQADDTTNEIHNFSESELLAIRLFLTDFEPPMEILVDRAMDVLKALNTQKIEPTMKSREVIALMTLQDCLKGFSKNPIHYQSTAMVLHNDKKEIQLGLIDQMLKNV